MILLQDAAIFIPMGVTLHALLTRNSTKTTQSVPKAQKDRYTALRVVRPQSVR